MFCSWENTTLRVPLSTQVYKTPGTGEFNAGGNPAMDCYVIQGGEKIFLIGYSLISS